MSAPRRDIPQQRATYLTLIGVFLSLLGFFSTRERGRRGEFDLRPLDLVLLDLATYHADRLAAYDKVTEPLRAPVTETTEDDSGQGTVEAKGTGAQRALGELVSWPTCIGTWAAAFMVYGLRLFPHPTRLLLVILGATGIAEILDSTSDALTKFSQTAGQGGRS